MTETERNQAQYGAALKEIDRQKSQGYFEIRGLRITAREAASLGGTAFLLTLMGVGGATITEAQNIPILENDQPEGTPFPDGNDTQGNISTVSEEQTPQGTLVAQAFMPTPTTPTATFEPATRTPTPTPTPGETAVAMVSLDSSRFVEASQLERFPQTISYTNPLSQREVQVNVDLARLTQIMTVNGTPLPLGVYDEQNPIPIDPRAFDGFQEWSGGDLRPAYIVGVLTEVNGAQEQNTQNFYVNPEIVVSIPLPATGDYFPVNVFMATVGGRFGAIDGVGDLVPLPENLLDDMGRIPYGQGGITYSDEGNWIAFPTSQGTSIIRVGDPIIVRVVFNLDVYNEGYRQGYIVGSSGRLPEEVVADLYDNNPSNDGQWFQTSSALATVFTPIDAEALSAMR